MIYHNRLKRIMFFIIIVIFVISCSNNTIQESKYKNILSTIFDSDNNHNWQFVLPLDFHSGYFSTGLNILSDSNNLPCLDNNIEFE